MRHITDTDMIAGYIVMGFLILAMLGALCGLAWSIVYPLIVMMMAAIP